MKKIIRFLFLSLVMCLVSGNSLTAQITDTLIINNGERRLFGLLHRPSGPKEQPMPIAILAHGFNGTYHYGQEYFDHLGAIGYQTYTFDFPCGSTDSAIDNNTLNMSIRDEQADLMAVVEYFVSRPDTDPSRIVLIGGSQGGIVAALAASAIPDKIHRLILEFPAFSIPDNYNRRFGSVDEIPDTTYVWKVPLGRRFFTELRDMDAFAVMPLYKRPVLILHGDKDPVVPLGGSERAVGVYPDARLKVIKGAGHGFQGDDFILSMNYITDFLKENQ